MFHKSSSTITCTPDILSVGNSSTVILNPAIADPTISLQIPALNLILPHVSNPKYDGFGVSTYSSASPLF